MNALLVDFKRLSSVVPRRERILNDKWSAEVVAAEVNSTHTLSFPPDSILLVLLLKLLIGFRNEAFAFKTIVLANRPRICPSYL